MVTYPAPVLAPRALSARTAGGRPATHNVRQLIVVLSSSGNNGPSLAYAEDVALSFNARILLLARTAWTTGYIGLGLGAGPAAFAVNVEDDPYLLPEWLTSTAAAELPPEVVATRLATRRSLAGTVRRLLASGEYDLVVTTRRCWSLRLARLPVPVVFV